MNNKNKINSKHSLTEWKKKKLDPLQGENKFVTVRDRVFSDVRRWYAVMKITYLSRSVNLQKDIP